MNWGVVNVSTDEGKRPSGKKGNRRSLDESEPRETCNIRKIKGDMESMSGSTRMVSEEVKTVNFH